jgi:hypothetical protein
MIAKQQMINVRSGGTVEQRSDIVVEQTMRAVEAAGDVRQLAKVAGANFDLIASELATLRDEIQRYDPKASIELQRLGHAEQAARSGNGEGIVENLRGVARWVIDFAAKIGVSVVAKILEKQAGL